MAQQRKMMTTPQSDLQPVYDVLDALHPARLKKSWQRLGRRTQWMLVMSIASLVLVSVLLSLMSMMIRHVRATSGAFLFEALRAPYDIETRALPTLPLDEVSILPASAGEYVLQPEAVQILRQPAVEAPVSTDGAAAQVETPAEAPAEAEAAAGPTSPFIVGQCLLALPETDAPCLSSPWAYFTSGAYRNADGTIIHAAAANFASMEDARQAMKDLRSDANEVSVLGNYALGVGPVDYFYSSSTNAYTFTWMRDQWVFALSGSGQETLDTLLQVFAY